MSPFTKGMPGDRSIHGALAAKGHEHHAVQGLALHIGARGNIGAGDHRHPADHLSIDGQPHETDLLAFTNWGDQRAAVDNLGPRTGLFLFRQKHPNGLARDEPDP